MYLLFREVFVLYGSQTGNAKAIAEELFNKCKEMHVPCNCQTLDEIKKADSTFNILKVKASLVVIVVATTGNGDAPENCDGFWRTIKLRKNVSYNINNYPSYNKFLFIVYITLSRKICFKMFHFVYLD